MRPIILGLLAAVAVMLMVLGVPAPPQPAPRSVDATVSAPEPAPVPLRTDPATSPDPIVPVVIEPVRGPNLIQNGSFEDGPPPGKFIWLNPYSESIEHWRVVNGQIDYVGSAWQAGGGKRSIDLNGSPGRGGVSQTIETQTGAKYEITFALAGNPMGNDDGAAPIKKVRVQVLTGGELTGRVFSFDTAGADPAKPAWRQQQLTFVAAGEKTTISFISDSGSNAWGPLIDQVAMRQLKQSGL